MSIKIHVKGKGGDLQSQIMIATTLAMKSPYPERKVVKTDAELRIFHGQIAKARNSTRYCPRGMVMKRGNRPEESEPKGICRRSRSQYYLFCIEFELKDTIGGS